MWWACFGYSLLGGLATFWGIGGLIHWWFYRRGRARAAAWKLQPERWLSPEVARHAFWLGSANLLLGSLLGATFVWWVRSGGYTAFTGAPHGAGWLWLPASLLLALALIDAGLYYSHRAFHGRLLFRYVHRWHHRYVAPTVFTTTAMHPVEFLVFTAALALPAFVIPMHPAVYAAAILYTYAVGMVDHSGVRFPWKLPLHDDGRFHDDHHVYFHCNFGHHTALFDRLHGTARCADRHYDQDTFGGRGAPRAAA
jgi:lathosterol oxidase